MNYNGDDDDMWDWRCDEYSLEDNTNLDISKCLLSGEGHNEDLSYMLDDVTTPVKACGEFSHHGNVNGKSSKELSEYKEASLQVKRRRMLQFEPHLDSPFCNEGSSSLFLRSKETEDPLEGGISEMSNWVSGFAEVPSASGNHVLDPSSEGWLADCLIDAEMQFSSEDINSSSASDTQVNITELYDPPAEYEATAIPERPVRTRRNVIFRGRKSYMRTPPKLASSVVYPFAFIKPCGVHGDVTLKDINQRIRDPPPKVKENKEDLGVPFQTSAFSGKPVVGKTKIRTEGGKGSITIMRTKG